MFPLTTLLGLIWAVAAVAVMVTHKVLGDALPVLAHELIAAARVVEHWDIKKQCFMAFLSGLLKCFFLPSACTHHSQLWRSRQPHHYSLGLRHTSNAEVYTSVIQDIGMPRDCRFWSLCCIERLLQMIWMPFVATNICEYAVNSRTQSHNYIFGILWNCEVKILCIHGNVFANIVQSYHAK